MDQSRSNSHAETMDGWMDGWMDKTGKPSILVPKGNYHLLNPYHFHEVSFHVAFLFFPLFNILFSSHHITSKISKCMGSAANRSAMQGSPARCSLIRALSYHVNPTTQLLQQILQV
ncbi:hypothetical protein ONS96_003815 [Cadophora gregata f. sp. sojae]|nr:hypothetical protein ONS96_003815 [Cadophora gregata f. sp. sojae]